MNHRHAMKSLLSSIRGADRPRPLDMPTLAALIEKIGNSPILRNRVYVNRNMFTGELIGDCKLNSAQIDEQTYYNRLLFTYNKLYELLEKMPNIDFSNIYDNM